MTHKQPDRKMNKYYLESQLITIAKKIASPINLFLIHIIFIFASLQLILTVATQIKVLNKLDQLPPDYFITKVYDTKNRIVEDISKEEQ